MAADQSPRRATRREPIEVPTELPDGSEVVFTAKPMPWRLRADFGELINKQFTGAINKALEAVRDESGQFTGLEGELVERNIDYPGIFVFAFTTYKVSEDGSIESEPPSERDHAIFSNLLEFDQMIAILDAALEVNGLERLGHMLDPRKKDPMIGESETPTSDPTNDT